METKQGERQKHTMSQDEATNGRKNINWEEGIGGAEAMKVEPLIFFYICHSIRVLLVHSELRQGQGKGREGKLELWSTAGALMSLIYGSPLLNKRTKLSS